MKFDRTLKAGGGLWDEWRNPEDDQILTSFTIVTCEAAGPIRFLHHRQPVMLGTDDMATWLHHDTDTELLHLLVRPRLPHALEIIPVSKFVSNSKNNGPKCIEPAGSSHQIAPLT
ncbi:MAG: SOS response-associated peptidase [Gammaproteobacteria bacterium]|nr:SOS response-associated peptidase [Gammaproteobacteria bacterium]MYF02302.1 SOS response-associated peptidase [Gammaproteobacteria bacterium]MYI77107.1 SOS response-associated peptidase [Gammaproteobacteria bacterium]